MPGSASRARATTGTGAGTSRRGRPDSRRARAGRTPRRGGSSPSSRRDRDALRKRHPRWGARRIHSELRARGSCPGDRDDPRALRRNHLVAPQPARRAKASKRFERELANDLWQIDGTQVGLAGRGAGLGARLPRRPRSLPARRVARAASPNGEAAWACFVAASAAYGLPRQLLSDNHASFTGRLFGLTAEFERRLAEAASS